MAMIADRKCGTCFKMRVRPTEVQVAQYAKSMSHCHESPVQGSCDVHGATIESTDSPCPHYEVGGPSVCVDGSAVKISSEAHEVDTVQQLVNSVTDAMTVDGNLLVFAVIGSLAFASVVMTDWKWAGTEVESLPRVVDEDGLHYPYKLLEGGRRVLIYLPSGRIMENRVTAAAARDSSQLQDEVYALVLDVYQSEG